jgi:hypothetical protein
MNRFIARVAQVAWLVTGAALLVVIGLVVFVCPDFSTPHRSA